MGFTQKCFRGFPTAPAGIKAIHERLSQTLCADQARHQGVVHAAEMMVKMADFKASLSGAAPAPQLGAPLAALWLAAKGNWNEAHKIAQDQHTADAAWVHAYLHRVEGDLGNAGYWYRQAGKPVATGSLETEWELMVSALLGGGRA
jgi:hypothetical protein